MTLRLNGATSGYTEIDAPAVAGNNNLKLPTGNGSNGNILGTDGAGNLSWVNGRMVLETAKASTSGTFVDFTGIPSWVKRVTVMFNGVSTNGTSGVLVQLGTSGGIENTGYLSMSAARDVAGGALGANTNTSGFLVHYIVVAAATIRGALQLSTLGSNAWVGTAVLNNNDVTAYVIFSSGSKSLSATLDRVRITTVNGTDTFDAGSINILYEG